MNRISFLLQLLPLIFAIAAPNNCDAQSTTIADGTFVGLTPAGVSVGEAGGVKTIPLRPTAQVSIRGPFDLAKVAKGMKVAVSGMIEDGSKEVVRWSVVVYPFSTPKGIHSVRYEPTSDKKGFWELDAFCEVTSVDPLTVRVLPGNEFAGAVYDDATRSYWYAPYKGPRPIGAALPLKVDNQGRQQTEIEFGANPQYAGRNALARVSGGGVPPKAEFVRITRTEAFEIPVGTVKKR